MLHHDLNGHILARYQLMECISGPCDKFMPDVYVDFIQGGQNLKGVFIKTNEGQAFEWNMLLALVNTIQTPAKSGLGDDQIVITPYGLCASNFLKPKDMHFVRKIHDCDFNMDKNHTLIDDVVKFNYRQHIDYRQNKKIDADIVFVEANEELSIKSPFYNDWNLKVHSYTFLEMMNRTRRYIDRFCHSDMLAHECATDVFGAKPVGKNWRDIIKNIAIGPVEANTPFEVLIEKYRNAFYKKRETLTSDKHSRIFRDLTNAVKHSSTIDIKHTIQKPENNIVLSDIAEVLGAVGTTETLYIAKEHFSENPLILNHYIDSLAYTTNLTTSLLKELKAWITEEKQKTSSEILENLLFTTSSLLNRKCFESTSSLNACNIGKDNYPLWFINELTKCDDKNDECVQQALKVLVNLPIKPTYTYATQFLCAKKISSTTQFAALNLLTITDSSLLDMEAIKKLVSIFRNTCPNPVTSTEIALALDILLGAVSEQQLVGSYLLRSESNTQEDPEKWQYFYEFVQKQRKKFSSANEYWNNLRSFKVFRPNYNNRALIASSYVYENNISSTEKNFNLDILSKAIFSSELLEHSVFSINLNQGKFLDRPIFKFLFDLSGTSAIADYEIEDVKKAPKQRTEEIPSAKVQLEILGHRYPRKTVFDGLGQLISLVWDANEETFKAHESNIIFREFYGKIPLMSGVSLDLNFGGAVSVKILSEAEISLWNRHAKTAMINNVSITLDAFAQIITPHTRLESAKSKVSVVGSVNSELTFQFAAKPYKYCQKLSYNNFVIRDRYKQYDSNGKKQHAIKNEYKLHSQTLRSNKKISQMCNSLESDK